MCIRAYARTGELMCACVCVYRGYAMLHYMSQYMIYTRSCKATVFERVNETVTEIALRRRHSTKSNFYWNMFLAMCFLIKPHIQSRRCGRRDSYHGNLYIYDKQQRYL